MKFSELLVGETYAVIPAWDTSNADKKDPQKVKRRDVAKANLVSLTKYNYTVWRSDKIDDPTFVLAEKGTRSVGYLVESWSWADLTDPNAKPTYWLARPQDIVCLFDTVEKRWIAEEAEKQRIEEEQRKKREEEERIRKQEEEYVQRLTNSVLSSLRSIIGDRANAIRTNSDHRRTPSGSYTLVGTMTMDTKTVEILVEKVLEARDMVR